MTDLLSLPARTLPLLIFFLVASFVSNGQEIPSEPAAISAGEALFNNNCRACHRVQEKLIGPPLAGVTERAPSIDWIISFVKNSAALIASGDEYAVALFNEYNKTQMTAFSTFSDEDVLNILAYVEAEAAKEPEVAAAPADGGPTGGGEGGVPATYLNLILLGMVVILVLLLIILIFLVSAVKRFLDQKDLTPEQREVVRAPFTMGSIMRSRGFIFIVVFVVAALGFKAVINGLYSIGIQQGYAPAQPIAFSHKIHAGQFQIDCNYCHTGVMTSKNANIPSANICMNCHNQIKQGTLTGEAEIAKIIQAYETNTPIEWVRVHNLPDLAYFNHAQHVNVGGVECQTCHGPIETMDVVRQHSLLTMGWCIDCHRTTELNTRGNAYYDRLVELHGQASEGAMKVMDNGGLDCSKCHY
ncbi:MAG TPA: c-type cytochrome [Cyclobacteriaceae bacterium]|nr:c-type cytochrome [Cyclobacteriaceae bacterium]